MDLLGPTGGKHAWTDVILVAISAEDGKQTEYEKRKFEETTPLRQIFM
jgi:hypothetical protein